MSFRLTGLRLFQSSLNSLPSEKLLINTINAHSYNIAQKDDLFAKALQESDILLPDGISIVYAKRLLEGIKLKKIAGADLFLYEMNRLNMKGGSCMFLGSSESNLEFIRTHAASDFPQVRVSTYSPPFKPEFSDKDNLSMLKVINSEKPDVLFLGMTAPKQEKWAFQFFNSIDANHICSIGAVFDFYAGSINRAPEWLIKLGLEWFYRFIREPIRLSKRYLIGNFKFVWLIIREVVHR